MVAAQRELVTATEAPELATHAQPQDVVVADPGGLLFPAGTLGAPGHGGEPAAPCPADKAAGGQLVEHSLVVGAHERHVLGGLVLEDPQLGGDVAAVAAVPVEVVLRQVEEHAHARTEALDVLELEARELGDDDRLGVHHARHRRQGVPDVAAHGHREAGVAEDGAGELGGRRLAVGAGDADERVAEEPAGQLDLAPQRHAAMQRLLHDRALVGDPGTLDEKAGVVRKRGRRPREDLDAGRAQHVQRVVVRRRALVEGDDPRRRQLTTGEQRRGPAAAAQAEHGEAAYVGEVHGHSLRRSRSRPRIRRRRRSPRRSRNAR